MFYTCNLKQPVQEPEATAKACGLKTELSQFLLGSKSVRSRNFVHELVQAGIMHAVHKIFLEEMLKNPWNERSNNATLYKASI